VADLRKHVDYLGLCLEILRTVCGQEDAQTLSQSLAPELTLGEPSTRNRPHAEIDNYARPPGPRHVRTLQAPHSIPTQASASETSAGSGTTWGGR